MTVDLFFALAIAAGFIAKERPSNKADIAYLYYLPFCMVFASKDKLHARTVPLFLKGKQQFLWAADLKEELKRLDEHYSAFPEDVKARGVMSFAHVPPTEGDFLTTRLWDEFMSPIWRKPREPRPDPDADPAERERVERTLRELNEKLKSSTPAAREVHVEGADFVIVQSAVPARLGMWRIVPPEAVKGETLPWPQSCEATTLVRRGSASDVRCTHAVGTAFVVDEASGTELRQRKKARPLQIGLTAAAVEGRRHIRH